ncbi:MAG: LWR-salt protein [Natronomonas sp.]
MTESTHASTAEYVFRVVVRIESDDADVRIVPDTFETTLFIRASEPGRDGWLFFRNVLWRGKVNAPKVVRRLATDALGEPVETVEFRELQAETAYYDAFREEISTDLDLFNAETVEEVLTKYLGSSIRILDKSE